MARRLESEVCGSIGIRPEAVERLRWVDEALARAGMGERGTDAGRGRGASTLLGTRSDRSSVSGTAPLAYFWGEDAYSIDRAARDWAARLASPDVPMETWRVNLEDAADGEAGLGVSRQAPGARAGRHRAAPRHRAALRRRHGRGRATAGQPAGRRGRARPASSRWLARCLPATRSASPTSPRAALAGRRPRASCATPWPLPVASSRSSRCLPAGRLEAWLMERAAELGVDLEPSAARLLAERVGGPRPRVGRRPAAADRAGQRRAGEAGALSARRLDRRG